MKRIAFFMLFLLPCFAYEPWFTSTYIENNGVNQAPHTFNIQTFTTQNVSFGAFGPNYRLDSGTDQISTLLNAVWYEYGMTSFLDVTLYGELYYVSAGGDDNTMFFGPSQVMFGFMFLYDDPKTWKPNTRLLVIEIFPTTPYDRLSGGKNYQAGNNGSFMSGASFIVEKTLFLKSHPTRVNLNFNYFYQTRAHLYGATIFGGDEETNIKTNPSGIFAFNLGLEVSLTQKWVFCTDINYEYEGPTRLSGNLGTTTPAASLPKTQLVTLTPGMEYNFSKKVGILSNFIITPWGQNTPALFGIVFSVNFLFG